MQQRRSVCAKRFRRGGADGGGAGGAGVSTKSPLQGAFGEGCGPWPETAAHEGTGPSDAGAGRT